MQAWCLLQQAREIPAKEVSDVVANVKRAGSLNAELQAEIRSTVGEVRRLVYDLRPPTLDELGLAEAIRQRAARYNASEESGGLHVTVEASELPTELPAAVEVAAYRIVQEALMNVVRHAEASTCAIRLACPEGRALEVEVTDGGAAMPESPEFGVGLRSMQERAAELLICAEIAKVVRSWTSWIRCYRAELRIGRKVAAFGPSSSRKTDGNSER